MKGHILILKKQFNHDIFMFVSCFLSCILWMKDEFLCTYDADIYMSKGDRTISTKAHAPHMHNIERCLLCPLALLQKGREKHAGIVCHWQNWFGYVNTVYN